MASVHPACQRPLAELQADVGDHSIAEMVFDTACAFRATEWRHAKTLMEVCDTFGPVSWLDVASSTGQWHTTFGLVAFTA